MTVSVRDARSSPADKRWIESIYRDYLDDLAPLNTGIFPVLPEVGHSEPDQLGRWFADSTAFPLVILKSGERAGFAMVGRGQVRPGRPAVDYRMAEFFVTRPQRRLGIGRSAVPLILDRFAGSWEITEFLRNPGAVAFWRRVVAQYTRGRYQERVADGEVRQTFVSGPRRAPQG
ncbi:MAG: GNAT family N-acetyltransferase [Steroidobacteraceae bacterium]